MNSHTVTILFEDPFWIGLIEVVENGKMCVCKVTFGAEPSDQEVLEFFNRNWNRLLYSPPAEVEVKPPIKNPKRLMREAKRQTQSAGIGTKSQQALKQQHEEHKLERKTISRAMKEKEKERRFELKQAKRKEKHKGH